MDDETIDPEVMKNEIQTTKPAVPITVAELASLDEEGGVAMVQAAHKIVDSLRRASIALTSPQDWLLFKADDRVTAYLQDSGAQRVMALWGIEITPIGGFETTTHEEKPGEYAITCHADAYCKRTDSYMKNIEGTRYSDEDFCKDLDPIRKKIRVQQASVANRNGNAVRKISGLSNVAAEFLEDVWKEQGKGKTLTLCAHGKGYGSKADRIGAGSDDAPKDINPPICEICQKTMRYYSKGNKPIWYCPDRKKDQSGKWNDHSIVDADKWAATMKAAAADTAAKQAGA